MKRLLSLIAFGSLTPIIGLAQAPSTPPAAPSPAMPPLPPAIAVSPVPPTPLSPPRSHDRTGSFLGVEVARVPSVLSEQLDLPEGFGVLVDYVVPGSAADTAGVKAHDILKMVNDQIITGAEQISVLVRSFSDGQAVTLVVMHKGQEARLTATIHPRAASDSGRDGEKRLRVRRSDRGDDHDNGFVFDFNGTPNAEAMEQFQKQMAHKRVEIETETKRALEQARRNLEDAQEQTARAAGSRVDYDRTHVVLRDATGRIELSVAGGREYLKVRDEQGKVICEGPIDRPETRKKIPADILQKVETLERERDAVFPKETPDAAEGDRDGAS